MWDALEIFSYAPDEDKTFEAYYRRYEDIYITDCADWTDVKKVRLLQRKLGIVDHNNKKKNKLANLAFYKQLNYCQNYSAPKRLYSTKDGNVST